MKIRMKTQYLFFSLIVLFLSVGKSAEVCNTIQECHSIKQLVEAKLHRLNGGNLKFSHDNPSSYIGYILEINTKGERLMLGMSEAKEHCKAKGMRLPTAREAAYQGKKKGIRISEVFEMTEKEAAEQGYRLVKFKNPDGQFDQFYYSTKSSDYEKLPPYHPDYNKSILAFTSSIFIDEKWAYLNNTSALFDVSYYFISGGADSNSGIHYINCVEEI